ncbi:MAG: hypothetical protein H6742_19090 [Alphaproteobacteria bacterium]|nr:hypothetical protein [Alphaproteobacteria bacterium]
MQTVLLLIALATFAYVLAHFVVERLQARFLVTSGAEYLILGLLIGPVVPLGSALPEETLVSLHPVMSLVIGGVGLLMGLQANLRSLLLRDDGAGMLGLAIFLSVGASVGLGSFALLQSPWLGDVPADAAFAGAWVLASSAAVSSPGALELVQRRFSAAGPLTDLLEGTMRSAELLAIAAFGVAFCVFHASDPAHGSWNSANWLVLTVGVGVGLGLVFRLFIGDDHEDEDHIFLAILGIVVFSSGLAYYLQLSPLLVNLVLGTVLANIARSAEQMATVMQRLRRPVFIMLLILAGALWRPVPLSVLALVAAYLALRFAAKIVGGLVGGASAPAAPRDVGRGLLGHGDVAVAMAVSYRIVFHGPVVDMVFTAVLASVVLSELTSARQLKGLLIDSGDIQGSEPGDPGGGTAAAPAAPATTPAGAPAEPRLDTHNQGA